MSAYQKVYEKRVSGRLQALIGVCPDTGVRIVTRLDCLDIDRTAAVPLVRNMAANLGMSGPTAHSTVTVRCELPDGCGGKGRYDSSFGGVTTCPRCNGLGHHTGEVLGS